MLNLAEIQRKFSLKGIQFLVLVMPDKSSVYADDILAPKAMNHALSSELFGRGLAPFDLEKLLKEARTRVPDLYLPDDTHLSDEGYRMVAEMLSAQVTNKDKGEDKD